MDKDERQGFETGGRSDRASGRPMMSTAYFTHADCRRHDMGRGHPECPARLDAIEDHFLATGLADVLARHDDAPVARPEDLAHAHTGGYLGEIGEIFERVAESGGLTSV